MNGIPADERGAIVVEYAVLIGLVSVGCAMAIAGLGVLLVRFFLNQAALLSLPFP